MACTDRRGWTCCRQMACKRSAVRARLAPLVRSEIRTVRTASTAAKYSNGGHPGRRTCIRSGIFPRASCLQDSGFQTLNQRWSACHLRKSPCHRSRDSCHSITTGPPGGPFLPVTVAAFASSPAALPVLAVRPLPGASRLLARPARSLTAGSPRRLGASRRWCQSGAGTRCTAPLRRRVAPWRSPARLLARQCAT